MMISSYFAKIGFDLDVASIKKADKALDHIENKLKKLGKFGSKPISLNIGSFDVDQRKLNLALGNALDMASRQVSFEISRFVVNDAALLAALLRAARRLPPLPPGPNPPPHPPGGPPDTRRRSTLVGGFGGGYGGLLGAGLALGLGGYGLSALNQRNQQVVSAQQQSTAVVQQAGGTAAQGAESFQYLRSEANRVGFNFLDASQDYNKLISGLTGSGVGLKESQKVFSGFAELARVNKLDKTTQNRLFRALSQVAGKGKLQSEELTGQIAEALPGGTALFAQAYQKQIGGNKTGSEAIQQLLADMKKGKVTSDILTYAGTVASQRANTGGALGAASQASQAEQARYQNTVNDMAVLASSSGVEEGFARIFRTLNAGLSESNGLVIGLSEGFNDATKWADDLLLFPQSFVRALEGRDSLVADWLGTDKTAQLQKDWKDIKQIFTDISSIEFNFLPTLEATAKEIAAIMKAIGDFQRWKESATGRIESGQPDASFWQTPITWGIQKGGRLLDDFDAWGKETADRTQALSGNPESGFYGKPGDYDDSQKNMALELISLQRDNAMTTQVSLTINVDPQTIANMDIEAQAQALGNSLVTMFEQVNVNFPIKE